MRTRVHAMVACLVFLLAGISAAASPADQDVSVPGAGEAARGLKIILLRPSTRFEDVKTGAPLPGATVKVLRIFSPASSRAPAKSFAAKLKTSVRKWPTPLPTRAP